jgi:pimeloyl-ACP methyl ester carboxylesterase
MTAGEARVQSLAAHGVHESRRQAELAARQAAEDLQSTRRLYEEKAASRDDLNRATLVAGQAEAERDLLAIRLRDRTISAPVGPHTDQEWDKLAADVLRQTADGRWRRHYDVSLALPFKVMTEESAQQGEAALWAAYDAVQCPVLLVRGSESDLLTRETAQQMTTRGPHAQLVELPGIGHAPTFMHEDQIALARQFFLE